MKKIAILSLLTFVLFTAQSQNQNPTQNVCAGTTENYNITTALSGSTFAWTITPASGGTIIGTGNNINISWCITPGIYTVQVIETSSFGCIGDPKTVAVTIVPVPIANAGSDIVLCASSGASITLSAATVTNATSQSWTSSGTGSFNNNTSLNPVYTFSATDFTAGTVSFILTAFGSSPCGNDADTVTYTISTAPQLTLSSNSSICETFTLNLNSNIPGSTYSWTGPNSFTSSIQNPTVTNAIPLMSGTYNLTVSNIPGGCPNVTGNTNVVVNPKPTTSPIWHN